MNNACAQRWRFDPLPSLWYLAFGRHLEEIHVTWAHLEKNQTRLRTNTKTLEDLCSQSLETASPTLHDAVTTHLVTASQHFMTASARTDSHVDLEDSTHDGVTIKTRRRKHDCVERIPSGNSLHTTLPPNMVDPLLIYFTCILYTLRGHVTFDELTGQTAPVHSSSGPAPNLLTHGPISLGLVPNSPPAIPYVPPTNKDLELLFQPMFDEYFETPTGDHQMPPVPAAPTPAILTGPSVSISFDHDAPSGSHSPSSSAHQSSSVHHGVATGVVSSATCAHNALFLQLCDGPIIAFTVLHNMYCNHGFIYVTAQGSLKICQLPSSLSYDNYWPVQKIPLKATPHQVTYFAEKNLYPLIVSVPVSKPLNQVLSTLVDQESAHQIEHDNLNSDGVYTVEEFEVRIMEPESSGGPWKTKGTIRMQTSENALTVRVVTLSNTTTRESETLLAVGTAYVQGEDVAARGRVLLFSVENGTEGSQATVTEVYSKEMKGAISAVASLQGYLLVASGPKIILHKWTGSDLSGVAFFDAPPLYVVSLNIVKNFILIGDIHKSIYFLSWKENGSQLTLLAKDFGSLNCFSTEFLIDGSTLSLMVSDDQKNVQILYYAPKASESWKGQKLLSRAEFHVGAHVTKFLRLQMLPTSTSAQPGSDKTNRFALLLGTLDGSMGCIAPLDELTFRRLQSLQKKLIDAVPHVAGLNPKSFRQFHSNGKAHRPGPDSIVDCELLCQPEVKAKDEIIASTWNLVDRSLTSAKIRPLSGIIPSTIDTKYYVELAGGKVIGIDTISCSYPTLGDETLTNQSNKSNKNASIVASEQRAELFDRIGTLERDNLRLRGMLCVDRNRVDRLRRSMSHTQRDL
ncbi:cleavage and polyadenylation specificity factor subunit 1 [Tanacetum coccineum]